MLARKTKRGEWREEKKEKKNNQQAHKILDIFQKVTEGNTGKIKREGPASLSWWIWVRFPLPFQPVTHGLVILLPSAEFEDIRPCPFSPLASWDPKSHVVCLVNTPHCFFFYAPDNYSISSVPSNRKSVDKRVQRQKSAIYTQYSYPGAGHIIRISSKRWFISLTPFKIFSA